MAQRLISLLCLLGLAVTGFGQAFGRFGYRNFSDYGGLRFDSEGFESKFPNATRIHFSQPSNVWKPILTSDTEQTVILEDRPSCPQKAKLSLVGTGISLYFQDGIDFKLRCNQAPFLTWQEGSVNPNVSTPDVKWLVLSFRDNQPPLVLGFPSQAISLITTGSAGAWSVHSEPHLKCWVRVGLLSGLEPKLALTAGRLGKLGNLAKGQSSLWTTMPPKLRKLSFAEDLYSVTATWTFDAPGAAVPSSAMLAPLGGYRLDVRSATTRLPGWNENGPIDILKGDSLTIRFPIKRVPTGRCLSIGSQLSSVLAKASPPNLNDIMRLGLSVLTGERSLSTLKAAQHTTSDFVSQAVYVLEPWTKQQLPYSSTGDQIDRVAAQAFLMQALTTSSRATSEANSLLTSVSWRQDWTTWRIWTNDDVVSERATALAALAGAICPETERRVLAGMLQAGLSARHGFHVWQRREGIISKLPELPETLYGIRKGLFGLEGPEEPDEKFVQMLLSPLRIFSDGPALLTQDGTQLVLRFPASKSLRGVVILATAYPIDVEPLTNVESVKSVAAIGFTELHYKTFKAGEAQLKVDLPRFGKSPPVSAPGPSELTTFH